MRSSSWINKYLPQGVVQLLVFGMVGSTGTAVQYFILWLGVYLFTNEVATAASSIGFVAGAFLNHHLNRLFTFKTDKKYLHTLIKFMTSAAWLFLINLVLMYVLCVYVGMHYLLAQIITTAVVFFSNFVISKFLVF